MFVTRRVPLLALRNWAKCTRAFSTPVTQLTEDEQILRDTVRRFAEEKIRPLSLEMDRTAEMDPGVISECFASGFMGLEIPQEYGGAGMNLFSAVLTVEELARVDASVSVMVDVQNTLVNLAILGWGNEEQKQKWLPRLSNDTLGSFCLSEWSSGSDAFALKAKAELNTQGTEYIINGTKAWITNAKQAGLFIVMANVAPEKGYKGITAFLVERDNPGLRVSKPEDKLGIRASSTCEVLLENCVVPKADVLGEVGKGYKIAIETLNKGRIGIGAQMLGIAQGAFDLTIPYLANRTQFKTRICDFQAVQHQIARAAIDIETARLLVYNAARGANSEINCSMAKLVASETAERVSSTCLNLLGGVGQTKSFGVEKYFRDCKIGQIYEGTSNIQLQTIAKNITRQFNKE